MAQKQGETANKQGRVLETNVISTLMAKGLEVVPYKDWEKNPYLWGKELLLTDVPYNTIYGHSGKTEFKILSERYGEYRIECKWQQVAGSVDEKLPYLYLNCIEAMPEKEIIIILDGQGAKAGAIEWLKRAAVARRYQNNTDKRIQVMALAEFIKWANEVFRG